MIGETPIEGRQAIEGAVGKGIQEKGRSTVPKARITKLGNQPGRLLKKKF